MENPAAPASDKPAPTAASPAAPSPEKKPDEMASKFAALAKKERLARLAQLNLKQKEAALAKKEQELLERENKWESEFKEKPLEAIKRRGYSYEDITKAALNDGKFEPATEIKGVKDEIARLRQEQADKEKQAAESARANEEKASQQAISDFKERIGQHLEGNAEKYELTKLYDASELVFSIVEEHFARTQKVLSIDEACGLVEQYIEDQLERTSKESKKFQAKYLAAKKAEDDKKDPKPSTTTLSNNLNTSAAPSLLPAKTEDDRLKRALAALG